MAKQARSVRKLKPKHRAVKPRAVRPLDVARTNNHAARHEAKKDRLSAANVDYRLSGLISEEVSAGE